MRVDALQLTREPPDTRRAAEFEGEPMVQSFRVPLPGGGAGRAWITTAEALTVPGFGRAWVAERLAEADEAAVEQGLRLRLFEPALALAA